MYRKIHKRLTFVFTGITSLILILLSVSCLYLSEKSLQENSFLSFTEEMLTLISNLEQQTVISYEWLSKVSRNGRYLIALYDNGTPFSYTSDTLSEDTLTLLQEVMQNCADIIRSVPSSNPFQSSHTEFTYTAVPKDHHFIKNHYYVCFVKTGKLSAVILSSAQKLSARLIMIRICFPSLNLLGILLIFLFSRHYTKQLLSPIQASQEAQAAFIAAASHELRTPLCVILSSVSAYRQAAPDEKARFFHTIETESRRMSRLVTDMLTLARSDSHTWSFHPSETELDTVLLNTCETFRPLAAEKNISLIPELTEDLYPPCICDQERIAQVFSILISNGISYGKAGGYIKLKLTYKKDVFTFRIEDNGIGISNEAKEHIFERFYRADPSRSKKEHLGLGLCIAKEIMDAHHGSIRVTDSPDGGAAFIVRLNRFYI